MSAARRIDTREVHGGRCEPVHPDPRGKRFLVWDPRHTLRRYRNLVSPISEDVRQVEDVAFLAADVRWKELSQQKDAHQCALRDDQYEPWMWDHGAHR